VERLGFHFTQIIALDHRREEESRATEFDSTTKYNHVLESNLLIFTLQVLAPVVPSVLGRACTRGLASRIMMTHRHHHARSPCRWAGSLSLTVYHRLPSTLCSHPDPARFTARCASPPLISAGRGGRVSRVAVDQRDGKRLRPPSPDPAGEPHVNLLLRPQPCVGHVHALTRSRIPPSPGCSQAFNV
jgi:hypothetical protein